MLNKFIIFLALYNSYSAFAVQVDRENPEAMPSLVLNHVERLGEVNPNQESVSDALYDDAGGSLLVSKQAENPELLHYIIDFKNGHSVLGQRHAFERSAPKIIKNREGIFAFSPYFPLGNKGSSLKLLDENGVFQPFFDFGAIEVSKNHFTSGLGGNFIVTVDFPQKAPLSLARVRVYAIGKNKDNNGKILVFQGSQYIQNQQQESKPSDKKDEGPTVTNILGEVTAMAMSSMGRVKDPNGGVDLPANRLFGVAHSMNYQHMLHLWYFPNFRNDFLGAEGKQPLGHKPLKFSYRIESMIFSPTTFGLMAVANKNEGMISVLRFNWQNKELLSDEDLTIERSFETSDTPMPMIFGPHDELVAGVNQTIYLYTLTDEKYRQKDSELMHFLPGEYCVKILNHNNNFIAVGNKGTLQFGSFEDDRYGN